MKRKSLLILSISLCALFCFQPEPKAEELNGRWAAGLNYPGAGIRYFLSDKISIEFKGQLEKDISVLGFRGYYYFSHKNRLLTFAGLEASHVAFKGDNSGHNGGGNGVAGELFAGGEYFLDSRLSLQMDAGPAHLSLNESGSERSVSGLEYVVNFGINYYFGK